KKEHQSLYLDEIDLLLNKLNLFGFHFATLDIRQNSRIHKEVFQEIVDKEKSLFPVDYSKLSENDKIEILSKVTSSLTEADFESEITKSTVSSIHAMKTIQEKNGELGCNR